MSAERPALARSSIQILLNFSKFWPISAREPETVAMAVNRNKSNILQILVVDDSSSARMGIVSSLKGIGAQIHEADDGEAAYAFLKENHLKIDLVLSDLVMKKMHGDELCSKIRNDLNIKDLPIIILSSNTDKETVLKLFRAGANDFLFKPFMPEELMARIGAHLDQRRLHKILISTIEKLQESNRMKDHFLAACSHDFRSPLQGILGYADLLANDDSLQEGHKKILRNIIKSSKQLNELIESLLDIPLAGNSVDNITKIPMNLPSLLKSCITDNSFSALKKDISLHFSPPEDLPVIMGDPNALSRVFNNLLSNAVKFTRSGGTITVEIDYEEARSLSISVKDNGIGIENEAIPKIFDYYSKASRMGTDGEKSTGLGLFISRQLVELHHGKIDVESKTNEGSCFTVILPLPADQDSGTDT